jgi:hypothetical protein
MAVRRMLGFKNDATVGGSKYSDLASGVVPQVDDVWPVTGATVDKNTTHLDRNDEITGWRGNPIPEEFRKDPRLTIRGLLYPRLAEKLLFYAMGGQDVVTGVAPAARTHTGKPIGYGGAGILPALLAAVFGDDQTDRLSGLWVNSVTVNFPLEGHATYEAELWALYHASETPGTMPALTRDTRDVTTYKLRDLKAYFAGSPTSVPGVTGFSLTFTNNLVDDPDARFAAGQQVQAIVAPDSTNRRIWWPSQHFLGGSQAISGEINFSSTKHAEDVKHDLALAELLVAEVEGNDLATTPVVKEMLRLSVANAVRTGGGAEDLAKEGLRKSSYQYGGFIDLATGTDLTVAAINNVTTPIVA